MISIFNGRSRALGDGSKEDIYLQVSVKIRKHLHLFKGAKLAVFFSIALHTDKFGWSPLDVNLIRRETGYSRETVSQAVSELCKLTVAGHRVMLRDQRREAKGQFGSNRYLIFPTPEECEKYESPCSKKPDTVEPCTVGPDTVNPAHDGITSSLGEPKDMGKPHTQEKGVRAESQRAESPASGSRHSFETILEFVAGQQGVNSPEAVATARVKDGLLDRRIDEWIGQGKPEQRRRDRGGLHVGASNGSSGQWKRDYRRELEATLEHGSPDEHQRELLESFLAKFDELDEQAFSAEMHRLYYAGIV